ncbi:AAA family ATPase [Devosia aurantiaca]|uniref:AAA family ATPase n=1 Tax=Devosia aurantiaca TaxID=2714858 RepID=UPI001F22ACBE|nr:AAA family ATPase [Devosia aurantiaca]
MIELTIGSIFAGDGHLGPVIKELRQTFALAARSSPCVLLLDELDSFSRRDAADHNASFNTSLINELLTLLDGATRRSPGLVIIGATNRPDAIDPAVLRPGRFSTQIVLPLPDADGIEHILRTHLRGDLARNDLDEVVRIGHGMTSAELMHVVRTARHAARKAGRELKVGDLEDAALSGRSIDGASRRRVALHEAGHAVCATLLPEAPIVMGMTLLAKGTALARVSLLEHTESNTRAHAEAKIVVQLAGRAAEALFYDGDPSAGAANDLKQATSLLLRMRLQWGMYGTLIHHSDIDQALALDDRLRSEMEAELQRLFDTAVDILGRHRSQLEALSEALLHKHVLTGDEVRHIVHQPFEAGTVNHNRDEEWPLGTVLFETVPYRALPARGSAP